MKGSKYMPWFGEVQDVPDFVTITSSTYTVKASDFGKTLICNSSAAQTITLPLFGWGFRVDILRIGAGTVTVAAGTGVTLNGVAQIPRYVHTPIVGQSDTTFVLGAIGSFIQKVVTFTEDATSTTHTGTVTLPAGSWLHNIQVLSSVLWGAAAASMKVGDTADDDGYFVGVDLKATDLLVGEVLDTTPSTSWGGKEGAYLVAATGRRGPTSSNFAKYYAAGSDITGIVTVTTPAVTTGRTFMSVTYSIGENIAAVAA